ncbi:MAG: hypothetical protein HYV26_12120, partial [Candidatus Hydrogenedentes bacterium]|nr:hypothetical protein [Candidatus Hydrogenedentota bacterium]
MSARLRSLLCLPIPGLCVLLGAVTVAEEGAASGETAVARKGESPIELGFVGQMGAPGAAGAWAIALGPGGTVHFTDYYLGPADLDPGPGTFILPGTGIFISKLDASGRFIWAKSFVSPEGSYAGLSSEIVVDSAGNVYAVGGFRGTVDFDPGPGTFVLTSFSPRFEDAFVCKLDAEG